jgi:hypothetical protein
MNVREYECMVDYDFDSVYYFKIQSVLTSLIRSLSSDRFDLSNGLLLSAYRTIYPVLVGTCEELGPLSLRRIGNYTSEWISPRVT